jgi:acyl-CoA synthetase (AMP-forming)/AMP-acid ligase II
MRVSERISDVVSRSAELSPDQLALVDRQGDCTYGELVVRIAKTKKWLAELGIRPGDRVMLVGENGQAFVTILLSLAALDAWIVVVNARLSTREVDQIQQHSGARIAIFTMTGSPQSASHAKRYRAAIEERPGMGQIGVGPLNQNAQPEPLESDIGARTAALIYTSGTTGRPKGVMLTHRNILFVASVSAGIRSLSTRDRMYGVLPMSHAVGLSVVLMGTLLSGGTLYLTPRFDPIAFISSMQKDKLTIVLGTPSMFSMLLEYTGMKGINSLRFPALRIISSSGAPLQLATKQAVEQLFGLPLHNGYGITECSPNIAQTCVETPRTDTSVGRILPGVETRLVGQDGNDVPPGEVGELWVRGANIMKGYYRAPEETAAAINAEGWFNSRDLARVEDNHLFIVGRAKELIVHFGLNVYPEEVEAVLNAHPAVIRSAVVGRQVNGVDGGEEVVAFVEPAEGVRVDSGDLISHAARHLAPYKRPSEIRLVTSMPMTVTGKIMKDRLAASIEARSQ